MGVEEAGRGRNGNVVNNTYVQKAQKVIKNNHEVK